MQDGKEKFVQQRKDPHSPGLVKDPVHREGMARKLPFPTRMYRPPRFGQGCETNPVEGISGSQGEEQGQKNKPTGLRAMLSTRAKGRWAAGAVRAMMPDSLHLWVGVGAEHPTFGTGEGGNGWKLPLWRNE